MTRFFTAVLVVGVGAMTAACSSDAPSSSAESTGPPAVCSSTDELQASLADLDDVQVVENGTAALEDAIAAVRSAFENVADDASSQFATQVDGLQEGFDALQSAADTAVDTPSAATLSGVKASASALADDVTAFADDVASTC